MQSFIDRTGFLIKAIIANFITRQIVVRYNDKNFLLDGWDPTLPETINMVAWLEKLPESVEGAMQLVTHSEYPITLTEIVEQPQPVDAKAHKEHTFIKRLGLLFFPDQDRNFVAGYKINEDQYLKLALSPITEEILKKYPMRPVFQANPDLYILGNPDIWENRFKMAETIGNGYHTLVMRSFSVENEDEEYEITQDVLCFTPSGRPDEAFFCLHPSHAYRFVQKVKREGWYDGYGVGKTRGSFSGRLRGAD